MGLERPAKELLAGGGVLGDQQDRADDGGPAEGVVEVGQPGVCHHGVAVGAVAAAAGVVGEGARQRVPEDSAAAAALSVALRCCALGEEPEVGTFSRVAELPGVTPAVSGGIGMGTHHLEGVLVLLGRALTMAAKERKVASRRMPMPAEFLLSQLQLPAENSWQNT